MISEFEHAKQLAELGAIQAGFAKESFTRSYWRERRKFR